MSKQKEIVTLTTPHVEGDEDIGEIRNIVGFHIRLAHGAVYRHFTEQFAHIDDATIRVVQLNTGKRCETCSGGADQRLV